MVLSEALVVCNDVVAGNPQGLAQSDGGRTVGIRIVERFGVILPILIIGNVRGQLYGQAVDRFDRQSRIGQYPVCIPFVLDFVKIGQRIGPGNRLSLEIVPGAIIIMRRGKRRGNQCGADHRRPAAATLGIHLIMIRTAENDIRGGGNILRNIVVEVGTQGDALITALLDDSVLLEITGSERSLELGIAAGDIHGMVGDDRRAEHLVLPIGIERVFLDLFFREDVRQAVDFGFFIQIDHILVAAEHLHLFGKALGPDTAVVGDFHLPLFGAFRRDDDNAIGSPGAVNGRCRSIFQNLDRFDIRGIDHVDIPGESIDDPKRLVVALDRIRTANTDLNTGSGLSVELIDLYTRDAPLKGRRNRKIGKFVDHVAFHLGNGPGQVAFALHTVPDDYKFVHLKALFGQGDGNFSTAVQRGFPGGHTEIANGQYGMSRDCVKPANSLRIGNFAPIAAFYNNGSSRYGVSSGIQYTDRAIPNRVSCIPGL